MDRQRHEFRRVTALNCVAVGSPGRRTFYIAVGDEAAWVRVWLEKEELLALSSVIADMLETIVEGGHQPPLADSDRAPEVLVEPAALLPLSEFKLGRVAVGYDADRDQLGLFLYGSVIGNEKPDLTCWISRVQARTFGDQIDDVCAAGRPLCQLCGGAIDPDGHVCPKSNGHRSLTL